MYEQDRDVVRWGLHLIDVCSLTNDGSSQTVTCYEDLPRTETVKEGYCNPSHSVVENDEGIAHALQEELSKLAAAEALESSSSGDNPQNASILSQDWFGPSGRHLTSEYFSSLEGARENEASLLELEELLSIECKDQNILLEIVDESAVDSELGKRLNQMVAVPHVPKINGEIPSADEATSDHERLLNRLQLYDLVELKILGDGNCQFRSLSDQIYRSPKHHKFVREQVVNQLKSRAELYENYVPMGFGDYLKKMTKDGEWGDHITLQAAADWVWLSLYLHFVSVWRQDLCHYVIQGYLLHRDSSKNSEVR